MIHKMNIIGVQGLDLGNPRAQGSQQLIVTEGGKGGRASKFEHVLKPLSKRRKGRTQGGAKAP